MSDIGLDHLLVETARKVVTTVNRNGDRNYGTSSDTSCLYRDISTLNRYQNRNDVTIDGIIWFGANEQVVRGDVYYHIDEGYLMVERVIRAKRLVADNARRFIKCEVKRQRQIS